MGLGGVSREGDRPRELSNSGPPCEVVSLPSLEAFKENLKFINAILEV